MCDGRKIKRKWKKKEVNITRLKNTQTIDGKREKENLKECGKNLVQLCLVSYLSAFGSQKFVLALCSHDCLFLLFIAHSSCYSGKILAINIRQPCILFAF